MDEERVRDHDWPDEEGGRAAQEGLRADTGTSGDEPKQHSVGEPAEVQPEGERGPAGSGVVPGRGHLGAETPGGAGSPETQTPG